MTINDIENFTGEVKAVILEWVKNEGFTARKLTDTPTDDLQVVNKKYVDSAIADLGGYTEIARTTLTVASQTLSVSFTAKKYLKVILNCPLIDAAGAIEPSLIFNGDTGSNYNDGQGGGGSRANILIMSSTDTRGLFVVADITNAAAFKKQLNGQRTQPYLVGDSPISSNIVGGWFNTTNQITSMVFNTNNASDLWGAGSELIVLGMD